MSNPKSPAWYGGGMAAFLLPGANLVDNSLFYVDDVNGLDTGAYDGLSPDHAFQTITYALNQCTSGHNNYIIVLAYGSDPTLDATWPISVDVDNVQIIAAQCGSFTKTMTTIDSDGDTSCLSIDAHNVRVQGFRFRPGPSGAGVTFSGEHGEIAILDCNFEMGTYGVYSPMGGCGWGLEVSRCIFTAQSSHGIYIDDDPGTCRYADNTFTLTVDNSVGIEVTRGGNDQILRNLFTTSDATPANGWGITMSGIATDAMINGNVGMIAKANPGATPFLDTTAAGTCNWGLNYGGIVALYAT